MIDSNEGWSHHTLSANGIRFHYVTAGDGPLILLLHGFPQFWYAWRRQIPYLARRFRVVAPDLRGYGATDKPEGIASYRTDVLADDVAGIIHALGEKKAHVIGHDWGGGVAWAAALRHPEIIDKLVILNCPHPVKMAQALRADWRQMLRSWYIFFFQAPRLPETLFSRPAIFRKVFSPARPGTFSEEDILAYREAFSKPGAATAAINYYRANLAGRVLRRPDNDAGKIAAPTLLIWAEADQALRKELTFGMENLFSGQLEIRYVQDCSHWVMEENPKLVNELICDFLLPRDHGSPSCA